MDQYTNIFITTSRSVEYLVILLDPNAFLINKETITKVQIIIYPYFFLQRLTKYIKYFGQVFVLSGHTF